jgi:23S rRNA pseudouridine2457 synthase
MTMSSPETTKASTLTLSTPAVGAERLNPVTTLALHKPYGMLSRFTPDGSSWRCLGELGLPPDVWPIGRLDADSEGLLLLSSDKGLVDRLLSPRHKAKKTYWVQVERIPDNEALRQLERGVVVDGALTLPAQARRIDEPAVGPRCPPVRFRKSVPDCWIELRIVEGKNRQVRRMTAAVGHPTLRLVRAAVGDVTLGELTPGQWRPVTPAELAFSDRASSGGERR